MERALILGAEVTASALDEPNQATQCRQNRIFRDRFRRCNLSNGWVRVVVVTSVHELSDLPELFTVFVASAALDASSALQLKENRLGWLG